LGKLMRLPMTIRMCAVAAILAAPLLPPVHREGRGRAVVFAVDRSESVGAEGRQAAERFVRDAVAARGDARVGLVAFDGAAELVRPVDAVFSFDDLAAGEDALALPHVGRPQAPGTDVAAAVRLAVAALPNGGERRIVLLTDGRATRGDALAEIRRAEAAGIVVDTVPIGGATADEMDRIARVTTREPRLAEGEPAALTAEIHGKPGDRVPIMWFRDGKSIGYDNVQIKDDGTGTGTLTDPRPGTGAHVYEARSRWGGGPSAAAAVDVTGKPRAVVLSVDSECPGVLADALDKAEVARQVVTLGDTAVDKAALSAADIVVLADVPLAPSGGTNEVGLSPKSQEALLEWTQKGGGVIVTGGAFGFAPEYADAPIARMLPVEIENQGQVEDPAVAMAIMLDRSGSMAAMAGSHTKITLAVEAALAAASTLRPQDSLALGSVDTETHWNEPLGPVADLAKRREEIRAITAGGGGIYVYTALVDAYRALRTATAPVRHVILFADSADSEEQAEGCIYGDCPGNEHTAIGLAETALRSGITTSVVGIGREEDHDTAFLRKLAAAAGGRFYETGNAADLRRIFVSETRVATRSNLRDGPVEVAVSEDHPILAGVDVSKFPPLGGFVEAKRRGTADTALVTRADDRPILASWRYGLGKVVALTTDLRADWKNGWSSAQGAGQVLRQAVRFALRRQAAGASDVRVAVRERTAEITVEAPDEEASAPASIEAFAFGSDGVMHPVDASLERVAPGRWVARAPTGGQPFMIARVRDASSSLVGESVGQIDTAEELAAVGPDERALRAFAEAGSGQYDPEPEAAVRSGGPRGREPVPVWPAVLIAAAVATCADLWLRRRARKPAGAAAPPAAAQPPAAQPPAPPAPEVPETPALPAAEAA
jgi:uncharacterized membrane protein